MPHVQIFAKKTMQKPVPLASLQSSLCEIWGTSPTVTKLVLIRCDDLTDESFKEDVYVDVRVKGTEERTSEVVTVRMKKMQDVFKQHDLVANIRLEIFEVPRYFHLPPEVES